jgi:autotransporter-associated beta strand protein
MGESGPASANFSKDVSWPSVTSYAQVMSNSWSAQVPVTQFAATRSAEGIFRGAVTAACSCTDGGGTAWASGPFPGGQWEQGVLEVMQGAGALMAPVAESIKNTYPSTSFPFSWSWGGATRSVDDTKEYIHVLWPPSGNTLTLPAPTDGKVFANARLLANGQPVTLTQNGRAVRLTLTGTNTWNANDTVIAMDVVSTGDPYLANNTTPDATYTGSWVYSGNRATGEFGRDVHSTTVNGDFVEYSFNGTDIELVVSCGPNRGTMDIYIDGVFKQNANATDPTDGLRKTIYRGSGLTRGNHTLKVVKTGGTYLAIDAFKATELIDSTDPDVNYQALTFFNNTDTTPNPVGYIEYDWNWSWQQRDRNEYNYDAHWASGNGSTFWIHFNGTGVQFIGTYDGIVDFYIDEVFVKRVNMKDIGGMARCLGLDLRGLPAGNHTLKGVKVGDTYLLVDAFFVYNSTNSSWSSQTDSASVGGSYRRSSAYGDAATLAFQGTGIEIIAPHQSSGGTVAVDLQGSAYQTAARQFVNQYAAPYRPQSLSFASRNVAALGLDNYSLSMSHNRGFGSIAVDAFRVYKNRPGSGPALKWGSAGGGGSGTWDVNTTANWWDGANATAWYDLGAADYSAQFAGTAGTVSLAANVNVNRLSFDTTGYAIQGNAINLNGSQPLVSVASGVTATVASTITGSNGLNKQGAGTLKLTAANSYSGGTTVNQGSVLLDGGTSGYARIKDALTVNSGASVNFANDDGTGLGWLTGSKVTSLAINGGTVISAGIMHIWDFAGGVTMTGGTLASNGGVSDPSGGFLEWHGTSVTTQASAATATIGGRIRIRSDGGYSGIAFTVADGTAATDLLVSAAITEVNGPVGITKNGSGTMVLSGSNSYAGATSVNQGIISVTGSVQSTSSITIAAGAELRSSGTLQTSGNVTNSGTLSFSGSAVFSAGGTITNYGTIINTSPSLVLPGNIVNYGTILTVPSAPTGLTATPSGTSAVLAWNAVSGASSYRVKQATSASGPFTLVASPTTNSQTVSGLTAGTTYYFVVSAVNAVGEGANSSAASCPIGALPLPWVTADIGAVGISGSATAINGTYTVKGSGTGVYASTDQFRMVYQNSSGDCDMIARVDNLTNPSVSAKAGVMIRESLATNARCAGVYVTPSSGVQFIWRTTAGSMPSIATVATLTAPQWVRIQRVGNSFKAYYSANGTTWTQFGGNKTISMATSAYMGQTVTSGTNSSLCTGVFSNVTAAP